MVTLWTGISVESPKTDPIKKLPGGMTIISGQTSQSLNTDRGFRAGSSALAGKPGKAIHANNQTENFKTDGTAISYR